MGLKSVNIKYGSFGSHDLTIFLYDFNAPAKPTIFVELKVVDGLPVRMILGV